MDADKLIGALLLAASVLSTCYHESQVVRSVLGLEEARALAMSLPQPVADEQNDGRVVLFSSLIQSTAIPRASIAGQSEGQTRVSPFVSDPVFGVAVKGVRLHRQVEMLQWVETSHVSTSSTPEDDDRQPDEDRERVYMYDLRWRDDVIDSHAFNDISYRNPPEDSWQYRSLVVKADELVVGDFGLADALVDQIQRKDRVQLDAASRRAMASVLQQRHSADWMLKSALSNASIEEDQYIYLRQDATRMESELGDLRVSFTVTPNYPVTVCATQSKGATLAPFIASNGESIFLLEDGVLTVHELFDKKIGTKARENWFHRLFASVLGFIGFLVLRPSILARYRRLVTHIQQHLLASSLSVSLTFTVVGLNWVLHRPLWAVAFAVVGFSPTCALLALQQLKWGAVKND